MFRSKRPIRYCRVAAQTCMGLVDRPFEANQGAMVGGGDVIVEHVAFLPRAWRQPPPSSLLTPLFSFGADSGRSAFSACLLGHFLLWFGAKNTTLAGFAIFTTQRSPIISLARFGHFIQQLYQPQTNQRISCCPRRRRASPMALLRRRKKAFRCHKTARTEERCTSFAITPDDNRRTITSGGQGWRDTGSK